MSLLRFRYILKIPNSSSDIKSDSDLMHVLFRLFGDVITSFPLHHGTPLWQCCSDVHSDLTCEGACQIQWIGRENLHRKPWDKMGGVRRTFPQHQREKSPTTLLTTRRPDIPSCSIHPNGSLERASLFLATTSLCLKGLQGHSFEICS